MAVQEALPDTGGAATDVSLSRHFAATTLSEKLRPAARVFRTAPNAWLPRACGLHPQPAAAMWTKFVVA